MQVDSIFFKVGGKMPRQGGNEYYIYENIVFVKATNCNQYFICDLDDWENVKCHRFWMNVKGYILTSINGKNTTLHSLVLGCKEGYDIDHINRCKFDNRKRNLRHLTRQHNNANSFLHKNNTSGHRGITWDKSRNKWIAGIKVNYKRINLGRYNDIQDAIEARKKAEIKYFGEYYEY